MLHLLNFRKAYPGGPPVIALVDWHLPPGIHWLEGPNGSGKTTLFRSLAGLIPCQGTVQLTTGATTLDLHRQPIGWRRVVNYGEAEPLYPPYLSAHDLVNFVAEAKQAPAGQVNQLADALGLAAFWHQPTGTYSSGMLKKTSLVLALLGRPQLVLLDEPLITLDGAAQRTVGELVAAWHAQGTAFLLSSHQAFDPAQVRISSRWRVINQTVVAA